MTAAMHLVVADELVSGVGAVVARDGAVCAVVRGSTRYSMKRARSCLLAPQVGDLVLFSGQDEASLYVLAILERDDQDTEVSVEGDLSLRARRCEMRALDAIELRAGAKISAASTQFEVRASRAEAFLGRLEFIGRQLSVEVERARSVAVYVDRLFGSVRERVTNSYRTVEELEHVRAGSIDIASEGTTRVHGRHTLVGAEALVKVDGPQIHLG